MGDVCCLGHLAYASWEHRIVALGSLEVRESEYQCKEEDSPPNSLLGNLGSADGLKTGDQMVAHHCPVSHISPSGRSGALVRISVPQGWQSSCFPSVLVGDECSRPLGNEQCLASLTVELAVLGFNGCFGLLGVRRTVHHGTLKHNPFASTNIHGGCVRCRHPMALVARRCPVPHIPSFGRSGALVRTSVSRERRPVASPQPWKRMNAHVLQGGGQCLAPLEMEVADLGFNWRVRLQGVAATLTARKQWILTGTAWRDSTGRAT